MTGEDFVKLVNYYGEENIIGVAYDNSAASMFAEGEFKLDKCYIADVQAIQTIGFDSKGRPFHCVKTLDDVQTIIVRDASVPFSDYDRYSIRP